MRPYVLFVSSVVFVAIFQNVYSWSGNVCSRLTCSWKWEPRCSYSTWNGCCAWTWVLVNFYRSDYFCCHGWVTSTYQNCDLATCRPPCGNGGTCNSPSICSCLDGYTGDRCYGAAQCSYTSPCYPGDCQGLSGTGSCVCSTEFSGSTCLTVAYDSLPKPIINRCNATLTFHKYDVNPAKDMDIYSYFGDATEQDEPYILWSNQKDFNILDMSMEVQYDTEFNGSQVLPDYVSNMKLGIINAKVETQHFKLGAGGLYNSVTNEVYTCNGPSRDQPISNEILVCRMNGTNYIRVDSTDRLVLTFSATAGGFRKLRNRYTNEIYSPQYYSEHSTSNIIEFKFDYESPIHCIEKSVPCSDKKPLQVSEDITKNSITATWDGWLDELSNVSKYSIEVWKMEYSSDYEHLREPLILPTYNPYPVFIQEMNVTNPIPYPSINLTEPGIYSCILEVSDNANNSQYARRFVLFDRTSEITTQYDKPIQCTTASSASGYKWQTDGENIVHINWKDHFINTVHAHGHFLSTIGGFEPRLSDGGRRVDYKKIENTFDDYEGKLTRNGIENINGIVKFEFAYQSLSADVSNLKWADLDLSENYTLTLPSSEDGFSQKFWVRASDVMGNTYEDTTVVYFDSSPPYIGVLSMQYNFLNGPFTFSSRLSFVTKDDHSGVPLVTLKIVTQSGEVKYKHRYTDTDLSVNASDCRNLGECYCTQADRTKCYMATLRLNMDNCWIGVALNTTIIEPHKFEITSYNGAMLSREAFTSIINVTDLSGIQEYNGVTNLEVAILSENSLKLSWEQPKSCYEILEISLILTNEEGHSIEHNISKDTTSYIVGSLDTSATYIMHMFTKYGTDEYFKLSDSVNATITLALPKQDKNTMLIVILSVILSTTILIGTFVALILCFKQGKLKCKPLNKSLKTHGTSSTVSRSVQEATSNRTNLVNNKDSNESFRMQSVNKIFLQRLPKIGECKTETDNEIFEIDLPTGRANALPPINTKLQ